MLGTKLLLNNRGMAYHLEMYLLQYNSVQYSST